MILELVLKNCQLIVGQICQYQLYQGKSASALGVHSKIILGDEFHFLFECNGIEKLRISSIPKYYRTRCSTLKMSQLLNTNDRKLLIKVAKFVYFGMKEYTSLPDVVSEEIDNVDLNCLYD